MNFPLVGGPSTNPLYYRKWESRFTKITVVIDLIILIGACVAIASMVGTISTSGAITGFAILGLAVLSEPLLRCCKRKAHRKAQDLLDARPKLKLPPSPPESMRCDRVSDDEKEDPSLVQPSRSGFWNRYHNHKNDDSAWTVFWRTLGVTFHPKRGLFKTPPKYLPETLCPAQPIRLGLPDGEGHTLSMAFGGHATFVFHYKPTKEADTRTILLEPSFVEDIPLVNMPSLLGGTTTIYDRIIPSGFTACDIGHIDACVISHNHRDHCAKESVEALRQNNPDMYVLAPEGTGSYIRRMHHLENARDHDWWGQTVLTDKYSKITFTAVPAAHSSCRGVTNAQKELWAGWVIELEPLNDDDDDEEEEEVEPYRIWMMGDTSCHINTKIVGTEARHQQHHQTMFTQIKNKFKHFDLVLWPIDPYEGEEDMHLNLDQGIDLFTNFFQDTDIDKICPMHFGAWGWGSSPDSKNMDKPRQKLHEKVPHNHSLYTKLLFDKSDENSVDGEVFGLNIGEQIYLSKV